MAFFKLMIHMLYIITIIVYSENVLYTMRIVLSHARIVCVNNCDLGVVSLPLPAIQNDYLI